MYLDEAGVDDTADYPYRYGHHAERFHAFKLSHQTQRISMVTGWCNRTVLDPMTYQGHCDTCLFEAWVERYPVPELSPGQAVVSQHTQDLIEQAGCTVLFLPPYSPDFNKIEKFWARLKHHLRKTLNAFNTLWNAVDDAFGNLS